MSWMAKAALAAALLNCGLLTASADDNSITGQWLKDGDCSLYSAGAGPGDTVRWTGECVDGYAEGLGTATFTHDGQTQSFTANFTHGVIPDGHVITRWGQGWSYDGETVGRPLQWRGHPDHQHRGPFRRPVDRRQDERLRHPAPRQWRALCRRLEGRQAQRQRRTAPRRRHARSTAHSSTASFPGEDVFRHGPARQDCRRAQTCRMHPKAPTHRSAACRARP